MFVKLWAIFILGFALLLCGAPVWSQDNQPTSIRISGRVVDPASFQIPNVAVTLKVVGREQSQMKVVTDETGHLHFPRFLPTLMNCVLINPDSRP